ncbi:peptidylprolyl isomerase [Altererythrobacter aestiaquae]|uniref:Parvulin-like PPIase n=2 Tax=Pontixanthobacter aestiaquae TaxID=1509367 RepID=A0A844Z9Y1_9SPHN|nr:peptidylprolyl isomerase [Pontixanthobacter aestiaquae]
MAISPIALQAQTAADAGAGLTGGISIPDNISILQQNDPNNRSASAVVNGSIITGTDLDHRVALLVAASQGELPPEELKRVRMQVFRNLIDETLQIQEATAQEVPVTDAEVNQRYAQVAAQNFGTDPGKMDTYLLGIGSSPASLKRQIRGEIAWNNVIRRNVAPFVNISEEEVREELARREAEKGTEEYRIGEIYLSATPETQQAALQNAQQIVQQLEQGGSFVAYARQFSESSSAARGGDLGFVRLNTLPAAMAEAARQMQPGQLVGPFEIPGGLMIMLLIDKRQIGMADPRDAMLNLKQISIGFPADVDQATVDARVATFTNTLQSMRGCGDAEAVAATIDAEVVASDIRARALPEQMQGALLSMQIGQITAPFGSAQDGVRVLMLCGRDDPEQVSGADFETVMREKEEERIEKRAQRYLRDLRNDAYIEYN